MTAIEDAAAYFKSIGYVNDYGNHWTPGPGVSDAVFAGDFNRNNAIANLQQINNGGAPVMSVDQAAAILSGKAPNPRQIYDQVVNGGNPGIMNGTQQADYTAFLQANYLPAQLDPSDTSTGTSISLANAAYATGNAQASGGVVAKAADTADAWYQQIGMAGLVLVAGLVILVILVLSSARSSFGGAHYG